MSIENDDASCKSQKENLDDCILNKFPIPKYVKSDVKNVQPPTPLQKIFRCRNQINSQYYLTCSRKEVEYFREVLKEQSPLWRPQLRKEEAFKAYSRAIKKEIRDEERKQRYFEHDTARSKQSKDLRSRLHVPHPPDDVHTIVDIDPEFFSIIEGRPIRYKFDKTDYINDIRDTTLFKLEAGYRFDEVLRINQNLQDEEEKYNEVCSRYNECVDSFENFLSDDYNKAITMLTDSDKLHAKLQTKIEEFKAYSLSLGIVTRNNYVLEENYRHTKMYQDFLYRISPRAWREEHGIPKGKKYSVETDISSVDSSKGSEGMFAKYQLKSSDGTIPPLMTLIERFYEDQKDFQEPALFFTQPYQLLKIFSRIILQNAVSWYHAEHLADTLNNVQNGIDDFKTRIAQEYKEIEDMIDDLNNQIEEEEMKAKSLKDKALKIVYNQFYNATASEYAVKMHMCVKDVYEKLIANVVGFSTYEMLKQLQTEYEATTMQLDSLDPSCVNKIRQDTFVADRTRMKLAQEAKATLTNLYILRKNLRKAFEHPPKRTTKPEIFRYYLKGNKNFNKC